MARSIAFRHQGGRVVAQADVEDSGSGHGKLGKYRVQFDKATYGLINGGGPEIQLTTFNGNIYIRKRSDGRRDAAQAAERSISVCLQPAACFLPPGSHRYLR